MEEGKRKFFQKPPKKIEKTNFFPPPSAGGVFFFYFFAPGVMKGFWDFFFFFTTPFFLRKISFFFAKPNGLTLIKLWFFLFPGSLPQKVFLWKKKEKKTPIFPPKTAKNGAWKGFCWKKPLGSSRKIIGFVFFFLKLLPPQKNGKKIFFNRPMGTNPPKFGPNGPLRAGKKAQRPLFPFWNKVLGGAFSGIF